MGEMSKERHEQKRVFLYDFLLLVFCLVYMCNKFLSPILIGCDLDKDVPGDSETA